MHTLFVKNASEVVDVKDKSEERVQMKTKGKPVCLYLSHRQKGLKHYIKKCKKCTEEEKEKYYREYIEERKASRGKAQRIRKNGGPKRAPKGDAKSSILFTAVFGSIYREKVCAENGEDGNILDKDTLLLISAAGVDVSLETLRQPRVFEMAVARANSADEKLTCSKKHRLALSYILDMVLRYGCAT